MDKINIDFDEFETKFNIKISHNKKNFIEIIRQIVAKVWKRSLTQSEYNQKMSDTIKKIENILPMH